MSETKPVIIRIVGGLGNQMFQYAAGLEHSLRLGAPLKVDTSFFKFAPKFTYSLGCFEGIPKEQSFFATFREVKSRSGILLRYCPSVYLYYRVFHKLYYAWVRFRSVLCAGDSVYLEKQYHFGPDFLEVSSPSLMVGNFQSEKHFSHIQDQVRSSFKLSENLLQGINKEIHTAMKTRPSVSIHIRRGDYVADAVTNQTHGTCDLSYYYDAVRLIAQKRGVAPELYIFSDSPDWAKANWNLEGFPVHFITGNYSGSYDGNKDSIDLLLMSSCRDHVIANSTFSWWAAWLDARSDKIVIAPKRWFKDPKFDDKDIIPSEWIRI